MISVDANTRIAFLLKKNPDALETIVGISPKFNKLRNPVLRKLLAGRASISMAAGIAGISVEAFMEKLKPLGFEARSVRVPEEQKELPPQLENLDAAHIIEMDVRGILREDGDPLPHILEKLRSLKDEQVLMIINSFEPLPLMKLLGKQGYGSYAESIGPDLVHTYFFKEELNATLPGNAGNNHTDWDEYIQRFAGKTRSIDVRQLEMPAPMITILEALETLAPGEALFVYHKRIPLFLFPELADRKFSYRTRQVGPNEVHLLIFRA